MARLTSKQQAFVDALLDGATVQEASKRAYNRGESYGQDLLFVHEKIRGTLYARLAEEAAAEWATRDPDGWATALLARDFDTPDLGALTALIDWLLERGDRLSGSLRAFMADPDLEPLGLRTFAGTWADSANDEHALRYSLPVFRHLGLADAAAEPEEAELCFLPPIECGVRFLTTQVVHTPPLLVGRRASSGGKALGRARSLALGLIPDVAYAVGHFSQLPEQWLRLIDGVERRRSANFLARPGRAVVRPTSLYAWRRSGAVRAWDGSWYAALAEQDAAGRLDDAERAAWIPDLAARLVQTVGDRPQDRDALVGGWCTLVPDERDWDAPLRAACAAQDADRERAMAWAWSRIGASGALPASRVDAVRELASAEAPGVRLAAFQALAGWVFAGDAGPTAEIARLVASGLRGPDPAGPLAVVLATLPNPRRARDWIDALSGDRAAISYSLEVLVAELDEDAAGALERLGRDAGDRGRAWVDAVIAALEE